MLDLRNHIKPLLISGAAVLEKRQKRHHARWKKKQTILCISLFNSRLKALSIINNSIDVGWERPEEVVSPDELRHAVQEAIHYTQYCGTDIAVMMEDPRFVTCTLQVPPMDIPDLLPILERKVCQEKTGEGPAAWRYRISFESRGKLNIHLEIWPQEVVDELVQLFQDLHLYLRLLLPLSALAESQLRTLPVEQGEGSLLVAMLQKNIMFIAGKDDGTPIWIRHLLPSRDGLPFGERVGTEVNRTMMFLTQQANVTFSQIWFLGEEEEATVKDIQPYVSVPVLPFPITPDWKYWLWVGANIPITHACNFTPPQVLQAPLRRMLANVGAAIFAGFIIFGVGISSMIEGYLAKQPFNDQTVTTRISSLQHDHEQWKMRLMSLQKKRLWVHAVKETPAPDLEGPFLSYLGTIVPDQMILHRVLVERAQGKWNMELEGSLSTNLATALLVGDQLVNQLGEGPYHVDLHEDWRDQLLSQPTMASTSAPEQPLLRFTMKGTML